MKVAVVFNGKDENIWEEDYELPAAPRIGEGIILYQGDGFEGKVTNVYWTDMDERGKPLALGWGLVVVVDEEADEDL